MELWAGNERAHRSVELAGLQSDVIAMPSGGDKGGDLSAVFSCSDNIARVVLADCVGHGYTASGVARHVHQLLHKFQGIRDTAGLLAALNDAFTLSNEKADGPLRLTTVVTGTFDGTSGEFNFAYAAHPRMLLWRQREGQFLELGEGLEGFPLGYITGEIYNQQSVRLNYGDMILAFSDGATEVRSPAGEQLTSKGFLELAEKTLCGLPEPLLLQDARRRATLPRPTRRAGRRHNAAHAPACSVGALPAKRNLSLRELARYLTGWDVKNWSRLSTISFTPR
jgi:serine phosphatase RsbU (regulator of sigma subunit)